MTAPWHVKSGKINEIVQARDQFEAWDALMRRPVEDFGLVVTAEKGETGDPIPIRTSALMFSWCRDADALRLIEVAVANDLGDTEAVDRESGAEIAGRRGKYVPRTKLWGNEDEGYVIVLECRCGNALNYPGHHPDELESVECPTCGQVWVAVSPDGPACPGCGMTAQVEPSRSEPGRWICHGCAQPFDLSSSSRPSSANTAEATGAKDGDAGSSPAEGRDDAAAE